MSVHSFLPDSDAAQTAAVFSSLNRIVSLLSDVKSDLGGKLDYLTERNLHLQVAVEKIGKRLDHIEEGGSRDPRSRWSLLKTSSKRPTLTSKSKL